MYPVDSVVLNSVLLPGRFDLRYLELEALTHNEAKVMNVFFMKNKIHKIVNISRRYNIEYSILSPLQGNNAREPKYYGGHLDRQIKYQVFTYNNQLFDGEGKPVNTRPFDSDYGAMLVMDEKGHLFLDHKKPGGFFHKSFRDGREFAYGCMLDVKDGNIIRQEPSSCRHSSIDQREQFQDRLKVDFIDSYDYPDYDYAHIMTYKTALEVFRNTSTKVHFKNCLLCKQSAQSYILNQKVRDIFAKLGDEVRFLNRLQARLKQIAKKIRNEFDLDYLLKIERISPYIKQIISGKFDNLELAPPSDPNLIRNDTRILFVAEYYLKSDQLDNAEKLLSWWGSRGENLQFATHQLRLLKRKESNNELDLLAESIKCKISMGPIQNPYQPPFLAQVLVSDNLTLLNHVEDFLLGFKLVNRPYYEEIDAWSIHELTLAIIALIDYCESTGNKQSKEAFIKIGKQISLPLDLSLFEEC